MRAAQASRLLLGGELSFGRGRVPVGSQRVLPIRHSTEALGPRPAEQGRGGRPLTSRLQLDRTLRLLWLWRGGSFSRSRPRRADGGGLLGLAPALAIQECQEDLLNAIQVRSRVADLEPHGSGPRERTPMARGRVPGRWRCRTTKPVRPGVC